MCGQPTRLFHHRGLGDPSPGDYRRCHHCRLIHLDTGSWPDQETERGYYRTHENRPDDPGYQAHLQRLIEPLLEALPPPARGLDWGCGPQPVLAALLRAGGYTMDIWDPTFAPAWPDAPDSGWDFITCTEVLEHLHSPLHALQTLHTHLRPGGVLAVMTEWPPEADRFRRWHYRRDPTHVAFYGPDTLHWIADRLGCALALPARDIALFTRSDPP
ncbi:MULTISPECIES: class I SAM-dependent methyltransferase [unclassified Thioalkalivibrio]|uniref:class I SAM-dependent methyltransferase n=1 Tax=unclassified Thioalkalivibrio TaxID=2621013 RepID=UPI000364003C|nr:MULTISPECIES: class I SAM-dependent methyltransferase [unclassified Thioalkalivibrio]